MKYNVKTGYINYLSGDSSSLIELVDFSIYGCEKFKIRKKEDDKDGVETYFEYYTLPFEDQSIGKYVGVYTNETKIKSKLAPAYAQLLIFTPSTSNEQNDYKFHEFRIKGNVSIESIPLPKMIDLNSSLWFSLMLNSADHPLVAYYMAIGYLSSQNISYNKD